mgnify:CR=1 FL=1
MCRNEIIIMMERERVLSWPELYLTGSWPALDLFARSGALRNEKLMAPPV